MCVSNLVDCKKRKQGDRGRRRRSDKNGCAEDDDHRERDEWFGYKLRGI